MPNKKITAMPSLAGNQVPTDLVTAVDLSAAPVNQNVKSTLNDLFSTITKNITDRAIRFQAPGSAPAVSAASQGALYHNGTSFQASSNGGAYEQVFTLSAQTAALVFAGPATGGPAVPTFRALALTDLPQIATDRILGRVSSGTGVVEQITPGSGVLTWLQTPSSANLLAAVTDETGGGLAQDGLLVFNQSPTIVTPTIAAIRTTTGSTALTLTGTGSNNRINISPANQPTGPTIESVGSPQADIDLNIRAKGLGAVQITGTAVRSIGVTSGSNTGPGILEARGGNQAFGGGKLYLYERSTNGTNYVGFEAPDSLVSDLFWTLPDTDGTANQALVTDGGATLSWASFVANSINTNRLLGRVSPATGAVEQITPGTGVLSWLQTPSSTNLRTAMTDETGSGSLVFGTSPTLDTPTITTSATVPIVIGGTTTTSSLRLRSSSGVGSTGADIIFQTGNNGSTEPMRILNQGNVGINNTAPSSRLTISDTNKSINNIGNLTLFTTNSQGIDLGASIGLGGTNGFGGAFDPWSFCTFKGAKENSTSADFSGYFSLATATSGGVLVERFRVTSNGNFGIGTSNPASRLHVDGTIRYTSRPPAGTITAIGFDINGDLTSASSSLRYKRDVTSYEKGLSVLNKLRPVTFRYNQEERYNSGFIAEEVDEAGLLEVMLYDNQNQPEAIIYTNLLALIVKSIQELYQMLDVNS